MLKMKSLTLFIILAIMLAPLMAIKLDSANPDLSEKAMKKMINEKLKDLKKWNVKKIIIMDCTGEYTVGKTVAPGSWEGKDLSEYEKKDKIRSTEMTFNQEFCVELTSQLMDSTIAMFNRSGFEVLPMDSWKNHPVYLEMLKLMQDYDESQGTNYGMISQTVTTRTIKVPAYGLRVVPDNVFKMIKFEKIKTQDKGKILEDIGADAFCNIAVKVDYDVNYKPFITKLDLFFETGMKKYDMGTKDKDGNKVYMYSLTANPYIAVKDILEYQASALGASKLLDTNLYGKAVTDMQNYILNFFSIKLKAIRAEYKE